MLSTSLNIDIKKKTDNKKVCEKMSVTIERKRSDCSVLPKGWQREEVLRKSGISAGKVDIYYYSPSGKRIETKPQLARNLGDAFDVSNFDFQTGKMMQYPHHLPLPPSISLYRCSVTSAANTLPSITVSSVGQAVAAAATTTTSANTTFTTFPIAGGVSVTASTGTTGNANTLKRKYKSPTVGSILPTGNSIGNANGLRQQQLEFSRALHTDASLVPPIRQTASIFKQPVTVVRNHERTKHDGKHTSAAAAAVAAVSANGYEKPQQLFWEKRLERLRACHAVGEDFDDIALPKSIRPIGPNVNEQTVLRSLATALHVLSTPVMGQTSTKAEFQKNANAFINPEQPLMQAVLLSEDDIRRQEDRVCAARRKLQEALLKV